MPAVEPGKARLVFYRSGSAIGALDQPSILMDGLTIGKSESGYYSYADVAPGKHVVELKGGDRIAVEAAAGSTAYLETSVKAGINDFKFNAVQKPEAEATQKIAKLKFRAPMPAPPAAGPTTRP
jgi:hypothetical protein